MSIGSTAEGGCGDSGEDWAGRPGAPTDSRVGSGVASVSASVGDSTGASSLTSSSTFSSAEDRSSAEAEGDLDFDFDRSRLISALPSKEPLGLVFGEFRGLDSGVF